MEPDWLGKDIKLESGQVVIVQDVEKYKLKNSIEFVSKSVHKNYIQLAQKFCLHHISKKNIGVIGIGLPNVGKVCSITRYKQPEKGLDCEWNWKTGSVVDLIQISTPDINLAFQNFDRLPPELIKILKNDSIKKVGVNIVGFTQIFSRL